MNDRSKLLLSITLGGIALGAGLSQYTSPRMNAAPGSDWRDRYRPSYSDTSLQFVDAGPIDLSPPQGWPGMSAEPYQAAVFPADYAADRTEDYADYAATEFADSLEGYAEPAANSPQDRASPTIGETVDRAAATAARLEPAEIPALDPRRLVFPNNPASGAGAAADGSTNAL